MGWVYLRHEDTEGSGLFPDEPGVIEAFEARGWVRYTMPPELDPDAPNVGAGHGFEPGSSSERILSADEVIALRGQSLDDALEAAGLSKSGTADEKRTRLAEYEAGLADTTTEGEVDNG